MEINNKKHKDELLKLLQQLKNEVTCPICLDLYVDPVCLECDHFYCKTCFMDLIKASTKPNSVDCPLCKKFVSRRSYVHDEKLIEVVKLVKRYQLILLKQPIETPKLTPKRLRTPKTSSAKKFRRKKENYTPLKVINSSNLKKAKSFDCLHEHKMKTRQQQKRHSLGNAKQVLINDKENISQLFSTQNIHQFQNDRQVIQLMEEDCLANLEKTFQIGLNEVPKEINQKDKTNRKDSRDWKRMERTVKNLNRSDKKLKQLNINTFTTPKRSTRSAEKNIFETGRGAESTEKNTFVTPKRSSRSTSKNAPSIEENPKRRSTRSSEKMENIEKENDVPMVTRSGSTYKLDQFETYLQEMVPVVQLQDVDLENNSTVGNETGNRLTKPGSKNQRVESNQESKIESDELKRPKIKKGSLKQSDQVEERTTESKSSKITSNLREIKNQLNSNVGEGSNQNHVSNMERANNKRHVSNMDQVLNKNHVISKACHISKENHVSNVDELTDKESVKYEKDVVNKDQIVNKNQGNGDLVPETSTSKDTSEESKGLNQSIYEKKPVNKRLDLTRRSTKKTFSQIIRGMQEELINDTDNNKNDNDKKITSEINQSNNQQNIDELLKTNNKSREKETNERNKNKQQTNNNDHIKIMQSAEKTIEPIIKQKQNQSQVTKNHRIDDDIFQAPTQELNLNQQIPQRNIDYGSSEIFDLCTQPLSEPIKEHQLLESESDHQNKHDPMENDVTLSGTLENELNQGVVKTNERNDLKLIELQSVDKRIIRPPFTFDSQTSTEEEMSNHQIVVNVDVHRSDHDSDDRMEIEQLPKDNVIIKHNENKEPLVNKNNEMGQCLDRLNLITNDILKKNKIVHELEQLLSTSEDLFVPIAQVKKVTDTPGSANKPSIQVYNSAVPHLNKLIQLYKSFNDTISEMNDNIKSINKIFANDKSNLFQNKKIINFNHHYEKIVPKQNVGTQTDLNVKQKGSTPISELNTCDAQVQIDFGCSKCSKTDFDYLKCNIDPISNNKVNLKSNNKVDNSISKKVNRQLFDSDKKFKRIRNQSGSSSDSETETKKKIKKSLNENLDIVFVSDKLKKSDTTPDVAEKYKNILEREYKEIQQNSEKIIITPKSKEELRKNESQFSKSLFTEHDTILYNSYKPLDVHKINTQLESEFDRSFKSKGENEFNHSFKSKDKNELDRSFKNRDTQLTNKSLFNDTHKDFNASFSLFTEKATESEKNEKVVENVNKCHRSPKELFENDEVFEDLSNTIVEDSLKGSEDEADLFENDVIEGTPDKTPFKRKIDDSEANLELLVEELQKADSELDLQNTEWVHNIAPPPEFQDTNKSTEFFSLSNPKSNNLLNERVNLTESQGSDAKSAVSLLNETQRSIIPLSSVQKEPSALTLVKSNYSYKPKTLTTTPKQSTLFNFIKTPSQSQSQSLHSSGVDILNDPMDITPIKLKSRRDICIACSRLKAEENMKLVEMSENFELKFSKSFNDKVTHLVVSVDDRNKIRDLTMKYVMGIANSVWVVSFLWVLDCLQHDRILPEEQYEVLDISGVAGPQKSRLSRKTKPLFKNFVFYCSEPFESVTKADLENVLTNLGGEIVKSLADFKKNSNKINLILTEYRSSQDFDIYQNWYESMKVITVEIEWLSRSVGQYEVISMRPFMMCEDNGSANNDYPPHLLAVVPESLTECTDAFTARH